jgi:ribonuclease J
MVKQETTITFHGGVEEIGGNKILVKDKDTRVFFDFGMSFSMKKQFYSSPYLSPRSKQSLQELGILPVLKGVYRDEGTPQLDAIFISHAHLDHAAYLSFVNRGIPIYCGETTRTILQTLGEIRRRDLEFDVDGLNFNVFRTGCKPITIGSLSIEPIHVDHSIPGAYGFLIHTSNGSIAYTGDFRVHGAKPEMTYEFVQKAKTSEPVAIVTEATNLTGASISSEKEVENKLDNIVKNTQGIVLAEFAYADVDRLNSFYRTAKKNDRCLALPLKQACLLKSLRNDRGLDVPDLDDSSIVIFQKSKASSYKWEKQIAQEYPDKMKIASDISKQQCKIILALSFYDLEELMELQPVPGSCYVLSASEPFNEEMEIDYEKLVNWLIHYGLPHYHAHVSGHIMPLQLKKLLAEINADTIFPVHTEYPKLFAKFVQDLKSRTIPPVRDKEYMI